jgi:hypothetical protein
MRSLTVDADHFLARIWLTLFVIDGVQRPPHRSFARFRNVAVHSLMSMGDEKNSTILSTLAMYLHRKQTDVIESSADDLASSRIGRGLGRMTPRS